MTRGALRQELERILRSPPWDERAAKRWVSGTAGRGCHAWGVAPRQHVFTIWKRILWRSLSPMASGLDSWYHRCVPRVARGTSVASTFRAFSCLVV